MATPCIIPMHPLNSDATAIKQDDAPPCYEAILIDSDKINKSELPLSRDIKEKEKSIGGDCRGGSGSKQVYKSKLRGKFNWKSMMISVITITAVLGSSVYIYLKMFKKSHDTNIAHGTAINARLSPSASASASVNLAPPQIVRIAPRPKVEKVDKGTGTDFPFDEVTSNGIVNLADVREREREMGVFNTVNTVNGNTVNDNIVNDNTVNMQPLSTQSARRFPAASNSAPISRFNSSPAPPPSNVQTRQFNTPVHLQTPVAMESRMSTSRIIGVNQETRSPAGSNKDASSESHASNTQAHEHADEQSQDNEVQIQTPQPSPSLPHSPSPSVSSESEIEIESISPASSNPQTSRRSSIGSEDELPMFYPLPFAILPDYDDQSEHESADTESD